MTINVNAQDILSGGNDTTDNPIALATRRATSRRKVSVIGSEIYVDLSPDLEEMDCYQNDKVEDWLNDFYAGKAVEPFRLHFRQKSLAEK